VVPTAAAGIVLIVVGVGLRRTVKRKKGLVA